MNLIQQPWLAAIYRDGRMGFCSPLDLGNPNWIDLHSPRPDFHGAMYQFLIGLLQTTFAPQNIQQWHERFNHPPSREDLEAVFAPYLNAFELFSQGAAFMQDFHLEDDIKKLSVSDLLIDAGSETNLYFNKPIENPGFCPSCFTQALFTLQINAPSGGRGTRVSLRGGGPLTTLWRPEDEASSLWQKIWINVLPLDALKYPPLEKISDALPWMKATRRSDGDKALITTPEPGSAHPLQAWWSMPRRIRIDIESVSENGICSLCGAENQKLIHHYHHRHGGTNYGGAWQHPLTPYDLSQADNPPLSMKGKESGKGYGNWLGLVIGNPENNPAAAQVIKHFNEFFVLDEIPRRIWCFGYSMDNMKALCWYESMLPNHQVDAFFLPDFIESIKILLDAAHEMADAFKKRVRKSCFKIPEDKKYEPAVEQSFWQSTEPIFYQTLEDFSKLNFDNESEKKLIFEKWIRTNYAKTLELFDYWTLYGEIENISLRKVIDARKDLLIDLKLKKPIAHIWSIIGEVQKKATMKKLAKRTATSSTSNAKAEKTQQMGLFS